MRDGPHDNRASAPGRVRYDYRLLDLQTCADVLFYDLAATPDAIVVRELLAQGYRWIRTEGEFALWEREIDGTR